MDDDERAALQLLDEDEEPPKKGRGEIISNIKSKLRKREGWSLDRDSTPPASPRLQLTADKPRLTKEAADPKGPQQTKSKTADPKGPQVKNTEAADPQGPQSGRSADSKESQPATSTPKIDTVEKAVLTLNLSEKDATAEKITSEEEENPQDGGLEKVDSRSAKQLGRARRNRARRARRKMEDMELSKSGGPDSKKQRTEKNSKSESSSPERTEDERPRRKEARPRFKPTGERPSFADVVTREDLVCSLVSDDSTKALTPADFTHFNDVFITSLEKNVDYRELVKYSVKIVRKIH